MTTLVHVICHRYKTCFILKEFVHLEEVQQVGLYVLTDQACLRLADTLDAIHCFKDVFDEPILTNFDCFQFRSGYLDGVHLIETLLDSLQLGVLGHWLETDSVINVLRDVVVPQLSGVGDQQDSIDDTNFGLKFSNRVVWIGQDLNS